MDITAPASASGIDRNPPEFNGYTLKLNTMPAFLQSAANQQQESRFSRNYNERARLPIEGLRERD
jgi:hypothetical protein